MLPFLSPAWVAALDEAARASTTLADGCRDLDLIVQQEITGGPGGPIVFHLTLRAGEASVTAGPAAEPTIRFVQDHATARAIAAGTGSAQRAFMSGSLRVGGDLRVLLDHQDVLVGIDDVFRAVRAQTDLGPEA